MRLSASAAEIKGVIAKFTAADLVPYGGGVVPMGTEAQVDRAFEYLKSQSEIEELS